MERIGGIENDGTYLRRIGTAIYDLSNKYVLQIRYEYTIDPAGPGTKPSIERVCVWKTDGDTIEALRGLGSQRTL